MAIVKKVCDGFFENGRCNQNIRAEVKKKKVKKKCPRCGKKHTLTKKK